MVWRWGGIYFRMLETAMLLSGPQYHPSWMEHLVLTKSQMKTMKKIVESNCQQSANYGSQNLALALLLTYHCLQLASGLPQTAKDNWEQRLLFWQLSAQQTTTKVLLFLNTSDCVWFYLNVLILHSIILKMMQSGFHHHLVAIT